MIELAYQHLNEEGFYDAISETPACIPDAVQILTPCTIGNGWLKIVNTGRFALILYDKYTGDGIRVTFDSEKLDLWTEVKTWALKLKPKNEQDSDLLFKQIEDAGTELYRYESVSVADTLRGKKKNTSIFICTSCDESFRAVSGTICPACSGRIDLVNRADSGVDTLFAAPVDPLPISDAIGRKALHDMTLIVPGKQKGPYLRKGDTITNEHLEILTRMGKRHVYVQQNDVDSKNWIHEDDAAVLMAPVMSGEGIRVSEKPVEGKMDLFAEQTGLFCVDTEKLNCFNSIPGVMCASLNHLTPVKKDALVAGTRAVPLFLPKSGFDAAVDAASGGLFKVLPYCRQKIGVIVTGSEVYNGIVEDGFIPIITEKVSEYGCSVDKTVIVDDDRKMIHDAVNGMVASGIELLVVTGGLSVDPDDVTRFALVDAGLDDYRYSMPVLPGAMTMTGRIGNTVVAGVPAGALFSPETAFDRLLPVLLASWECVIENRGLMGEGGLLV